MQAVQQPASTHLVMGMDQCNVLLSLMKLLGFPFFGVNPNCHGETTNILLMVQKSQGQTPGT